jgi:hypothetical protein
MRSGKQWVSLLLCGILGIVIVSMSGCGTPPKRGDNLLIVNFQKDKVLRYQMVSKRETNLELQSSGTGQKQGQPQKTSESLELVMAYKPLKVNPFGLTKIECTCESAKVNRSALTGKSNSSGDAIEKLAGKTFTLELSPVGKIEDFSQLEKLLLEVGNASFDTSRSDMRVKNPDMIYDFIALQWYLWDSVSSVPNPMGGVKPQMTWTNTQVVSWPVPVPNMPCRITTFTLDSMKEENGQQKAVIGSAYQISPKTLENFPKPYEGSFQMRSLFGFLRDYKFQTIQGKGQQVFNLTTGQVESDSQEYDLAATASFPFPLGDSVPRLNIHQIMTVKLLDKP